MLFPDRIQELCKQKGLKLCHFTSLGLHTLHGYSSEVTLLSPVQTGKVWRPNTITHFLLTKPVDDVLSGQSVVWMNKMFYNVWSTVWRRSNFTDQTRFNTIKQGVQTGKCLVTKQYLIVFDAKYFPFGKDFSVYGTVVFFRGSKINQLVDYCAIL